MPRASLVLRLGLLVSYRARLGQSRSSCGSRCCPRRLLAECPFIALLLPFRRKWDQRFESAFLQRRVRDELGNRPHQGSVKAGPAGARYSPAGSFFGGFRTPALYRVDRSRRGRHPKPFSIAAINLPAIGGIFIEECCGCAEDCSRYRNEPLAANPGRCGDVVSGYFLRS